MGCRGAVGSDGYYGEPLKLLQEARMGRGWQTNTPMAWGDNA